MIFTDLHYVGAFLNPHLIQDLELCGNQDAMARLMRIFQSLSDTSKEFQAIKVEFNQYFYMLAPYCGDHIWSPTRVKEVAHMWWFTSDNVRKLFPCIARRFLTQVVSSSSCKKNWSRYS
jgi:hypothetical protein